MPAGVVNDVGAAFALAERLGLEPVVEIAREGGGTARLPRNPIRLSATPASYRSAPPDLPDPGWVRQIDAEPDDRQAAEEDQGLERVSARMRRWTTVSTSTRATRPSLSLQRARMPQVKVRGHCRPGRQKHGERHERAVAEAAGYRP